MKIIGVIPARYSSSRFPGKPLADICGKPMIWWVYNQAKKVDALDEVIVATDDERIFSVCQKFDIKACMTSSSHRTGADRVAEVASKTEADIYLNIQGDEPLIEPEAILQIVDAMKKNTESYYIGLRSRIEDEEELLNPNVVKAVTDIAGDAMYFSRVAIPFNHNLDNVYRVMGLYGYRKDFLLNFSQWGQSALELAENGVEMLRAMEHGYKIRLVDTNYQSIAVDLPSDIEKIIKAMRSSVNE